MFELVVEYWKIALCSVILLLPLFSIPEYILFYESDIHEHILI